MTELLSVKDLAELAGISTSTLRAWERRFAIFSPERTDGGHRFYTYDDLKILWYVRRQQALGFDLKEISKPGRTDLLAKAISFFCESTNDTPNQIGSPTLENEILKALSQWNLSTAFAIIEELDTINKDPNVAIGFVKKILLRIKNDSIKLQISNIVIQSLCNFVRHKFIINLWEKTKNSNNLAICATLNSQDKNLDLCDHATVLAQCNYKVLYLHNISNIEELSSLCLHMSPLLICLIAPTDPNNNFVSIYNEASLLIAPHVVTVFMGEKTSQEQIEWENNTSWRYMLRFNEAEKLDNLAKNRIKNQQAPLLFLRNFIK